MIPGFPLTGLTGFRGSPSNYNCLRHHHPRSPVPTPIPTSPSPRYEGLPLSNQVPEAVALDALQPFQAHLQPLRPARLKLHRRVMVSPTVLGHGTQRPSVDSNDIDITCSLSISQPETGNPGGLIGQRAAPKQPDSHQDSVHSPLASAPQNKHRHPQSRCSSVLHRNQLSARAQRYKKFHEAFAHLQNFRIFAT